MIRWFLAVVFGATLFSGPVMAQNVGFYLGGAAGLSFFSDVESSFGGEFGFDIAPTLSGNFGYHFRPDIRLEAELQYAVADVDVRADDLEVLRGTISGYYEFADTSFFRIPEVRPHVGAGIGFANVELDAQDVNELTWHAEGGLSIGINDYLDFVPAVRFEHVFLDEDNGFDSDLWAIQLRTGLRFYLGN